jgi:acyl-CoA hydrolase
MKYQSPEQALNLIQNGETLWCHSMAATPYSMLNALAKVALEKRDLTLLSLHTEHSQALCAAELQGHLRQRVFFVGSPTRPAVQCGLADYVPAFLSEIPKMFRSGEQPVDTAIIQVSPPDKHGLCSLGISVEATRAALQSAKKIIAQINPKMPRTHGDSFVHLSDFDAYVELESDIPLHLPAPQDPITAQIGRNVASLVRDGDCLQMGIGAIPDATLACLGDRQNLGIHT